MNQRSQKTSKCVRSSLKQWELEEHETLDNKDACPPVPLEGPGHPRRVPALVVISRGIFWRRRRPPYLRVLLQILGRQPQHARSLRVTIDNIGRILDFFKRG